MLGDHVTNIDMETKKPMEFENVKTRRKLYIYKFLSFQLMLGLHGSCYYKP
jgi:hypothetical protein